MFDPRLIEAESELLAKEESAAGLDEMTWESILILDTIEQEIGLKLADKAPHHWKGWLTYRRGKQTLMICRGRAFRLGGLFATERAGFDVPNGMDAITDYQRGFDVTPAQDLDHLMINFGAGEKSRVFLWYGENIATYKLIFEAALTTNPVESVREAVVEACLWILSRPKEKTLLEFLKEKAAPGDS
ncbi:MAG TPA: hypothetical protein V6C72_02880 [Chroococcales cyanobacterium]